MRGRVEGLRHIGRLTGLKRRVNAAGVSIGNVGTGFGGSFVTLAAYVPQLKRQSI